MSVPPDDVPSPPSPPLPAVEASMGPPVGPVDPADQPQPRPAMVGQHISAVLAPDLPPDRPPPRKRRFWLPLGLFVVTCLTTFLAGCYHWYPVFVGQPAPVERPNGSYVRDSRDEPAAFTASMLIRRNWRDGLIYMSCVMGVLLMHEMGHFLMTIRHRIPASYPFFIPLPLMLTGTMGAVIGMEGSRANRKEVFDVGLAGPLAGLLLTIPLIVIGLMIAEPSAVEPDRPTFNSPLIVRLLSPMLVDATRVPDGNQLNNPFLMAGWVGLFVTGLNMLPISQLDGGHVSYAVLGPYSRWLGRGLLMVAIAYIVVYDARNWIPMLLIVIFMGTDHPNTADDTVDLGPVRRTLGLVSLLIPIFCFTPVPLGIPH
ncbi:MAG: site-2 protease family protein [Planctomycetia bacterium]|nr:site-2 protease family protein [Planctomycetia bacterium]